MDDECNCGQCDSYHEDENYGSDSGYGNEYHSCIYRGEYGYCTTPDSDEEHMSLSTASTEQEEKEDTVYSVKSISTVSCCPGPFSDLLFRLLPVSGTPVLINGQLISSTVSNDPSYSLSSLFLRDRSLSHHSILSSAYSIPIT
ncbi:hypothetical protein PENTCL1PPCAC_7199 [Pristionchus entomophagus]|uniref:Uncharacterized protein n=1 Tax=Pristionchus entomophagus TaxID=358040 RepID=A0AAV5SQ44_9BILA|nr:hypothetical protein PENTCL1PPCAC_7199 [Pristionchus entomophagus]